MRYAKIRKMDISNGEGIGVALFLQGCHFHCKGCFNTETWDFNGGKEWTLEIEDMFMELIDKPYIKRISILGGEPLDQTVELTELLRKIKIKYPNKTIWLYTGFKYEDIKDFEILKYIDVIVDGQYKEELKDLKLEFRGSSNQQIIKIKEKDA